MIWVLTAGFGDGHNSAARSVASALERLAPGERVQSFDLLRDVHPLIFQAFQSAYRCLITHWPALWRLAYDAFARPSMRESAGWMRTITAALDARLERDQPRLIISTYPIYSALLQHLCGQGSPLPPIVTVVTDSITVHPSWTMGHSDMLCVADEETRQSAICLGVAAETIRVTGFPVSLAFLDETPRKSPVPRVLYMPSTPAKHFAATLEALLPLLNQGVRLTLQTGRHAPAYYQAIRRFQDTHPDAPVEVIGWTDHIPRLLQTHDVLICKAGGAILHEALAARIPAIIDYVVPGQEEGNAQLLLDHHCGLRSHSPNETAQHLQHMLANDFAIAKTMRSHMQPLSLPDAALRVAELALSL